jgi:hypothetical protein
MTTNGQDAPVRASAFGCITIPFLLIALVPLLWGARGSWQDGTLLRDGEVVQGRVIELRHVPSNPAFKNGRGSANSAVATFTTLTGEQRTAVSSVNRYPAPWTVGQAVEVVYDPSHPERADLHTELSGWRTWFVVWCVVAAVPAAIACLPIVFLVRQRRGVHQTAS